MARSVPIWKILRFAKVSLYLERFVPRHATAHIHNVIWHLNEQNDKNDISDFWSDKSAYWIVLFFYILVNVLCNSFFYSWCHFNFHFKKTMVSKIIMYSTNVVFYWHNC